MNVIIDILLIHLLWLAMCSLWHHCNTEYKLQTKRDDGLIHAYFINEQKYKLSCQRFVFLWYYNQNMGVDGKGRILDLDLGPTVDSLRFQSCSLRDFMIGPQKLAPWNSIGRRSRDGEALCQLQLCLFYRVIPAVLLLTACNVTYRHLKF
jgi:hypothetical protein